MGGGSSAQKAPADNPSLDQAQSFASMQNNPAIQGIMSKVASGQMSVQDALNLASAPQNPAQMQAELSSGDPNQIQSALNQQAISANPGAYLSALSTDPVVGSLLAENQVMNDPTLAGLFGQGGLQSQAENQYSTASNNLANDYNSLKGQDQSYGLTNNDLAAYNQAAGNIDRMFGSQQQGLMSSLANRGLAAGDSGTAQQGFSNLYGNQLEQLAGLQTQIATNRINTAQQLAQARAGMDLQQQANNGQLATNLGTLGQNAETNAFNRNLQGAENQYNTLASAAGLGMQNQGLQQNINNSQWAQNQQSSFNPTSLIAPAVGAGVGAMTGGIGSAVGSSIGNSIVGASQSPNGGSTGLGLGSTGGLSSPSLGSYFNQANPYSK